MTASIFNVFNRKAVNGGSLSASRWKLKHDNQCGHNLSVSEHLLRLLPFAKFKLNCQLCWRWDLTAACDYSTDAVSYCCGISSHISIAPKVHIKNNLLIQCPIADSTKTHFQDQDRFEFHIWCNLYHFTHFKQSIDFKSST